MARKKKDIIPRKVKRVVFERDGYKCRYCGLSNPPLHCDHVYPESKGGETTVNNLVTACQKCNLTKHAKVGIWPMPVGKEEEIVYLEKRRLVHMFFDTLNYLASFLAFSSFVLFLFIQKETHLFVILLSSSLCLFITAYILRFSYYKLFEWLL